MASPFGRPLSVPIRKPLEKAVSGSQVKGAGVPLVPWISLIKDTNIFVTSDSLGDATAETIYKMGLDLVSDFPTLSVNYSLYDYLTTQAFPTFTSLGTGSGPYSINIRNMAIGMSQPVRFMTNPEWDAVVPLSPDLIVVQHGKNLNGESVQISRMQTSIEALKLQFPTAPIILIREPPNRDDNNMAATDAMLQQLAAEYGDIRLIDTYTPWITAGKPSGGYVDNLHPNGTGVDSYSRPAIRAEMRDGKRPSSVTPARLKTKVSNLLVNGDFSDWPSSTPNGWTTSLAPTLSKETTIKDVGAAYSLKITGAAGADIRQDLSAGQRNALVGQYVSVAVRHYVPAANPDTSGLFQIIMTDDTGSNTTVTHKRTADGQGRQPSDEWVWSVLRTNRVVGTNPTLIRFVYENDTANAGNSCYISKVVMCAGIDPRDML